MEPIISIRDVTKSFGSHTVLAAATLFAVYPVLWVVSLAFSAGGDAPEPRVVPFPAHPTLDNFKQFVGLDHAGGFALFLGQLGNSLIVSLATALVAVVLGALAIRTARRPAAAGP